MKVQRILYRVLLWLLQTVFMLYTELQKFGQRVQEATILTLSRIRNRDDETFYQRTLKRVEKQPYHLIAAGNLNLTAVGKLLQLVICSKTRILTLYDTNETPAQTLSSKVVEVLKAYKGKREIAVLDGAKVVYLAAESVKAEKYDLSQAKKMSADCLWICLQTLSKNSFTEFYDQLLNSAQSSAKKDWPSLSCRVQADKTFLKEILSDYDEKKFTTPLMISFGHGFNNCQGIRFQILSNAEIITNARIEKLNRVSLVRFYQRYASTKQRFGQ